MFIDILVAAILVICLIVIAVVIGRKFPRLATIEPGAATAEIQERKRSLIEERLRRKFVGVTSRVSTTASPVGTFVKTQWQGMLKHLRDLEHEYKVRGLPVLLSRQQRKRVAQDIAVLVAEAQTFLNDGETKAAEEKALQAVRLEPRSVPAFEFLARLYEKTKEYIQSRELYEYLIKLLREHEPIFDPAVDPQAVNRDHLVAEYHAAKAEAEAALDDHAGAFTDLQEAIHLEPNNPKFLDAYIDAAIAMDKKGFATDALQTMKSVNPDNSKIPTWEEAITALDTKPIVHNS